MIYKVMSLFTNEYTFSETTLNWSYNIIVLTLL